MKLIIERQNEPLFLSDQAEFSGVSKIAGKVRADIELITGSLPGETSRAQELGKNAVIYGTIGKSRLLEDLCARTSIDLAAVRGKRECYLCTLVKNPFPGVECALVIAGSDKRGTIYGLFHLSETLGVSPLVDWSDVKPARRDRVELPESVDIVSREPSVRYRGFFINDEWPAFGTWCNERFGGFNAKAYDHVFELLLRLKGNYLWPAMWTSSFSEDGPGLESAMLADEYGVVMGMSHHEPCLRHGEEYKHLRGKDSKYGDAWNFRTNREGIVRFWRDGLQRSGRFENVITVGMRGEADTSIMGRDATLKDNIDLLRDVLAEQNRLIRENVSADLDAVPRMIALYKEVEAYFYGDEKTPGLEGSPELDGTILMLCDDNFGNLRTLPTETMRSHRGGYGMYYHFDYHGWPVSYEWSNCSYLPRVWEQMTMAHDFGIDQLWVVNVGDICSQEFPLSYFLDLAYDFGRWGSSAPNSTADYTRRWTDAQFTGRLPQDDCAMIASLLTEYSRIAHMRRTEAMGPDVYHPAHFAEAERMLARVESVIGQAEGLRLRMPDDVLPSFYELVYFPAVGAMNVQRMQLLAGKNAWYAAQGRVEANQLASLVTECIVRDRALVAEYHEIGGRKWYGMGLSEHIGFKNWNEEECAYPLRMTVEPANKARAIVSIVGTAQYTQGGSWTGKTLSLDDFQHPGVMRAAIDISSGGAQPVDYEISCDQPWLDFSARKGRTSLTERIVVTIDRSAQGRETQAEIRIKAAGNNLKIIATAALIPDRLEPMTFVEANGYIAMEAEHYRLSGKGGNAEFRRLDGYGKTLSAMKVFPTTATFTPGKNAPFLEYRFVAAKADEYTAELYLAPSNPASTKGMLRCGLQINDGDIAIANAVPTGAKVGDDQRFWADGVLSNIRKQTFQIVCAQGACTLRVYAIDPGLVLERIVLHPAGSPPPASCLGPEESYFIKGSGGR